MLLPIDWLKQYVEVNESVDAVAERFISLGFECELKEPTVIDLEITPNRGDVLSILGLAREYAASTGQLLKWPEILPLTIMDQLPDFTITASPDAYHRISAIIIRNIAISPSPDWLKTAVESMGSNSINNIVDLTNYVMFELGIPIHAFDLDTLPANEFQVRLSKEGEKYTSLKDEERDLPSDTIVVECGGEIVDLLGIRGGKSTMISDETKNVLIWGASVPRPLIRRASKLLGIRTEGSYRHERETDWDLVPTALARITDLTKQLANGEATTAIDLVATTRELKNYTLTESQINSLLGVSIPWEFATSALQRLGFTAKKNTVTVPSWRHFDINTTEDLVEEVARLYGYNQIPRAIISRLDNTPETEYAKTENVKDQLIAAGLIEVYTESFAGREETRLSGWDESNLAVLANPVNRDFAYCRPALLPNLIKLLALNSWADDAAIFEIGNVFPAQELELTHLGIAMYGKKQALLKQWIPEDKIQLITPEHPLAQHLKLRRPITVAEVPLNGVILKSESKYLISSNKPAYRKVSALPPSVRDISMIVSDSINISGLIADINDTSPEHIILVELFDQFQSDKFGPNRQSLGIRIVYQSANNITLENGEVDALHQTVIEKLTTHYQAEIR